MLIKLFGTIRDPLVGNRVEVETRPGATVRTVLMQLFERAPQLQAQILEPDLTALLPFVNVMLKGRLVRDLQGLDTPVVDEDVIAIFPPSAGG